MKRILFTFLVALLITLLNMDIAKSDETEPPFEKVVEWRHHQSLGVILIYESPFGRIMFSHPVIDVVAAPECQMLVQQHNLIAVLSDARLPFRYTALRSASAYRSPNILTWKTLLSKTSGDFK